MPRPPPSPDAPVHPLLKWAGGKTRVVPHIRAALEGVEGGRLVEPFVGSGAVFLNLPRFRKLLLADANADLVSLYRHVLTDPDGFLADARPFFTPANNTRAAYLGLRAEFNAAAIGTRDRSVRFLYLNRHAFNGLCRYNAAGTFNVPFGRYTAPNLPEAELRLLHRRLADADEVTLLHVDFRAVFADHLRAGDVVYADPPYVPLSATASFTGYAGHGFDAAAQRALAQAARGAARRGIPVLLSNHDLPSVRALYAGATLSSFPVRRSISRDGATRGEIAEILARFDVDGDALCEPVAGC